MATSQPTSSDQVLFTCLSCAITFLTPEEQRVHYRSDHHRYNMKRRVASLPPVSAEVFDQKVLERTELSVVVSNGTSTCDICSKVYTTENAYRSHINSKRHRQNEVKATRCQTPRVEPINKEAAATRSSFSGFHCLFCPQDSGNLAHNLAHMSLVHSFFIPDADYLVDISGLIFYLGEKIAIGNMCIFCNKSREFRSLDAVRKHMVDVGHCKIAYDSADDRLEISDYYDFTSSYPDAQAKERERGVDRNNEEDAENWEDIELDNEEVDEIVNEDCPSEVHSESEESLPESQITFGDSHLELVLPSGVRIGHRATRKYHSRFSDATREGRAPNDPSPARGFVRRIVEDNGAVVPRKGGFGAFGGGADLVKARNRGEAREAGRLVREYRDQKRREDFKTKVAFIHNSQKHFRDPLLQ